MHGRKAGRLGATIAAIAAIVLLFALPAGAASAKSSGGGLSGKQKKEVTQIAKKYAGKNGANGSPGPAGPQGPAGPSSGPAGGVLTGSYPNPGLAAGAVGTANFASGAVAPEAEMFGGLHPSSWQKALTAACPAGKVISAIAQNGTPTCQTAGSGTVTEVKAGPGLKGGPVTSSGELEVNFEETQKRISASTCSSGGKAIKRIKEGGEVECETTGETVFPTLASGKTETGSWASVGPAKEGPTVAAIPISFTIPLASTLSGSGCTEVEEAHVKSTCKVHLVLNNGKELITEFEPVEEIFVTKELASSPSCTGSLAAPAAATGNLCVYIASSANPFKTVAEGGFSPFTGIQRSGAVSSETGASTAGAFVTGYWKTTTGEMNGTWAVTAP